MKTMKKMTALLLTLLMTLALVGCAEMQTDEPGDPVTSNSSDLEQGGIVAGSVLNFRLPVDVEGLLPWMSPRAANIYCQIYDTLIQPYQGDWNDLRGLLATDWTTSEDGLTWVFQITDKATFTNGKKLTAQSMVDCWVYTKQYQPSYFNGVDSIEATGEYELTFRLSAPNPALLANFANVYTAICDPETVAELGTENDAAAIGTGAYYVESKTTGEVTVLKANPNYWNTEEMPSIETLNYWYIPDNNTALAALQSGEIDVVDTNDYNTFEVASSYAGMDSVTCQDQVRSIYINATSPQLQDVRVRQALLFLIDMEELNLAQVGGYGTTTYSIMRTTCGAHQAGEGYEYNVDKGLALLKEAGVDPSSLNLNYISNTDVARAGENIQAQLGEVGINVNLTTYDVAGAESVIYSGAFDLGIVRVDTDVASALSMAQTWLASNGPKRVMWCDDDLQAQIDSLIDKAAAAATMEEQNSCIRELQTLILDNGLVIPGVGPCRWYVYNAEKLSNVVVDNGTLRAYWRYATVN